MNSGSFPTVIHGMHDEVMRNGVSAGKSSPGVDLRCTSNLRDMAFRPIKSEMLVKKTCTWLLVTCHKLLKVRAKILNLI